MIRQIALVLVLLFSLSGLSGILSIKGENATVNSLPFFEHPLVYRPSSQGTPGAPPYVPSDIRNAYDFTPLYVFGINGTGTRIAIVDAYGDPTISRDLGTFDSITTLPAPVLNIHYPDGMPATRNSGWAVETALDVEWAHAIAPAAAIDLVITYDSGLGHVYDGISYVASHLTNETALSMSFGQYENQYPTSGGLTIAAFHQLFVTMTSHGTIPFASSGDDGATTCCNVSYPASDSLVVAVGGTSLNMNSSAGYLSETAWSGSGAGSSTVFAKPSWQQNLPGSMRNIADVAYDSDPNTGVMVIENGFEYEVGGTSAGSPQWAGFAALASQAAGTRFGALGSRLYNLTGYHDVVSGSDGYFTAGPAWDYPSGLGTPDANKLIASLTGPTIPVYNTSLFQGLNLTATANLQVNTFTSTLSGAATVDATNATNGQLVFAHNYKFAGVQLTNTSMTENGRFLLSIPVSPFPMSEDISLMIQGGKTSVQIDVTRQVDISGGGTVNIDDVGIVLGDYNTIQGSVSYNPRADLAAVGTVNVTDFSIVELYFNCPVFS